MSTSNFHELSDGIFNIREKITDQEFKNLMDLLKKSNDDHEAKNGLYKITIIIPDLAWNSDQDNTSSCLTLYQVETIIDINKVKFSDERRTIIENKIQRLSMFSLDEAIISYFPLSHFYSLDNEDNDHPRIFNKPVNVDHVWLLKAEQLGTSRAP